MAARVRRRLLPRSRLLRRQGARRLFAAVRCAARAHRTAVETVSDAVQPCSEVSGVQASSSGSAQLHVLGMGLMGLGKSTLLRALARALGGLWLNQDEFSHLGRKAKQAFLQAIRDAVASSKGHGAASPVLIIDKINTLRMHREEILAALGSSCAATPPKRILCRFLHPADPPGVLGSQAVQLGLQRITARGDGHRTLSCKTPGLAGILQGAARGFEPPSQEELNAFDAVIDVDVTMSVSDAFARVLADLKRQGYVAERISETAAKRALASSSEFESFLRAGMLQASFSSEDGAGNNKSVAAKSAFVAMAEKRSSSALDSLPDLPNKKIKVSSVALPAKPKVALPLYWGIFFDEQHVSESLWKKLRKGMPSYFKAKKDLHVTLLFSSGAADASIASKKNDMPVDTFVHYQKECERWSGHEVSVRLDRLVSDDDALCVAVTLPDGVPCANKHPHITLAHSEQVGPVYSNSLLARDACRSIRVIPVDPSMQRLRGVVRPCWR